MVFRKTSKNVDLKISGPSHARYVPPVSRAPASKLVLQRGGLPSEIALQGGPLSPKSDIKLTRRDTNGVRIQTVGEISVVIDRHLSETCYKHHRY